MPKPKPRPFGVADILALVAATGLALALGRSTVIDVEVDLGFPNPQSPSSRLAMAIFQSLPFVTPMLLCLAAALLLLRLGTPRPESSRLWRQPGFLAGVAALSAFGCRVGCVGFFAAFDFARSVVEGTTPSGGYGLVWAELFWFRPGYGVAVALVWLAAWAAGGMRPEPGWIDRAGRVVGVTWIFLAWVLG